ncbi:predicted protein [Naegleria gruberi]|uniref:tRNA-intron lyase n=1 Tax=Naegleria gruberi TaxID=5762 RepID=D2VMC3_NAEGR|nr:uncharacterized protein NAEGRDRAFT_70083 [Naegleria gruberi]EFC41962.1 predicted protein [Naegleria gruberi]|eukprot:XP_002674706.1 predicted protein [Naegleria gruberi strain NEG-M]
MSYNQSTEKYSQEPKDITHLWKHPYTPSEKNKYEVFKDLHSNCGFFLTSGDKFGCDFLAYKGDPVLHHAEFLVYVQEYDKPIESFQMISIGRLANNVHKTVLFASWNPQSNQVEYLNMNWFNPQPIKTWKIKELCNKYKQELNNQTSH